MRKFFRYIKALALVLPVVIFNWFRYLKILRHPEKYEFSYKYALARKEILFFLKQFKVEYHVEGIEKLTKANETFLIISNHHSLADPLVYIAISERPLSFVSKESNLKIPFVGQIMRMLDSQCINRDNLMSQARTLKHLSEHLSNNENYPILIFIEGTRNRHPENELLEFHPGTLKIAYKANCSILPCSHYGTFRVFTMKSYSKTVPITVKVADPIKPSYYLNKNTVDLAGEIRATISNMIQVSRKEDRDLIYSQKLSTRRKALETIVDLSVNS